MKLMFLGISISLVGIVALIDNIGLATGTHPYIIVAVGLVCTVAGFLKPDK